MNARCLADYYIPFGTKILEQSSSLRFASVLLVMLMAVGEVHAGTTASISGTVTDPSGAAIVGATVTATNVETV
jgi:hypothetical protein